MSYQQLTDGQWWNLPEEFYLQCCHCSLVHVVKTKKLKNGRIRISMEIDPSETDLERRKNNIVIFKKRRRARARR